MLKNLMKGPANTGPFLFSNSVEYGTTAGERLHELTDAISRPDIEAHHLLRIEKLLGRQPRGLEQLRLHARSNEPAVIDVAPLVNDKPFPTRFWLVEPSIVLWLSRLEAEGVIARLQAIVDSSASIRDAMRSSHDWYKQIRRSSMTDQQQARLRELGFSNAFERKGIGGIADHDRVRCLHTWYAAHLVHSNPIGEILDKEYADSFVWLA